MLTGRREPENRAGRRTVVGATAAAVLRTKLALLCTAHVKHVAPISIGTIVRTLAFI